jgi:hypothetical protein
MVRPDTIDGTITNKAHHTADMDLRLDSRPDSTRGHIVMHPEESVKQVDNRSDRRRDSWRLGREDDEKDGGEREDEEEGASSKPGTGMGSRPRMSRTAMRTLTRSTQSRPKNKGHLTTTGQRPVASTVPAWHQGLPRVPMAGVKHPQVLAPSGLLLFVAVPPKQQPMQPRAPKKPRTLANVALEKIKHLLDQVKRPQIGTQSKRVRSLSLQCSTLTSGIRILTGDQQAEDPCDDPKRQLVRRTNL